MTPGGYLYEGEVRHRRTAPVPHAFRYRLFMLYVDVERLAETFRGRLLWSTTRPNVARFRRSDYLGPTDRPLADCVRDLVEERLGRRPSGPVRLLTHFRYFGIAMNPLSLFYCFDEEERLEAIVAEVSNTPWNEQYRYVLDARRGGLPNYGAEAAKDFHVSPFLGMDYDYVFEFDEPGQRLQLRIANRDRRHPDERPIFEAALEMRRRPLNGFSLAGVLVRYPAMTLRVLVAIYYQAARIWWKGVPFYSHPDSAKRADAAAHVDSLHDSLASSSETSS